MPCEQPRCYGQLDGSMRWWHSDGQDSKPEARLDDREWRWQAAWTTSLSDVEEHGSEHNTDKGGRSCPSSETDSDVRDELGEDVLA